MKVAVRAPNWIGDAVLALPALAAYKSARPEDEVWVAARGGVKDLFASGTPADGVIGLEDDRSLRGLRASARRFRGEGFGAGLLLTNSFGSALMFFLAGIPERWGYRRDGRGLLLTRAVPWDEAGPVIHQAEYYLRLVRGLNGGAAAGSPSPIPLFLSSEERAAARRALADLGLDPDPARPVVVLNPGASYGPAKRWSAESFGRLGSLLQAALSARVVVTGLGSEVELAERLASVMPRPPLILSGRTSLRGLLGILSQARLCVTNDSGPLHLANAVGTPVIGLFGPTDPAATGPLQAPAKVIWKGAACWPCLYRSCPFGHECLTAIEPGEVLEAAREYLG
jgi:heptosyltransferase-2